MLGIVTALFIPVFLWSSGLTSGTRSFWELSGMIATERIVIEEVNLQGGSSNCTIYVRNIGKTAIIISDIVISDETLGLTYLHDTSKFQTSRLEGQTWQLVPNLAIIQGDLMKIFIPTLGFTPTQDFTYMVKVFTIRGVGDQYQVKA